MRKHDGYFVNFCTLTPFFIFRIPSRAHGMARDLCWRLYSRQQFFNHMPMHISEATVDAVVGIGEAGVVDA